MGLVAPRDKLQSHSPGVSQTFHLLVWVPRGLCSCLANLDPVGGGDHLVSPLLQGLQMTEGSVVYTRGL